MTAEFWIQMLGTSLLTVLTAMVSYLVHMIGALGKKVDKLTVDVTAIETWRTQHAAECDRKHRDHQDAHRELWSHVRRGGAP